MPSWPTSVFAPTNKSAGNTIQPTHVNDLQDEVVALEGGLFNGTARHQSSNLSVTGASTFASRPVTPPPDAALVFLAAVKDMGSSADSTLSFVSQEVLINSSLHSTGTNPERLTPQSTGLYAVSGQLTLAGPLAAASHVRLTIKDSTGAYVCFQGAQTSVALSIHVSGYKRFDAVGGHCVLTVENLAGGSTASLSTGVARTWFSMVKL